ncbi:hypothetical protein [Streptomyces sp. NPDC059874]|uniref:hypothetical protein n=1 Tax=Streptomyces sp. NPDC059874 TaxID=3346983 RepID=UPI00364C29B3
MKTRTLLGAAGLAVGLSLFLAGPASASPLLPIVNSAFDVIGDAGNSLAQFVNRLGM